MLCEKGRRVFFQLPFGYPAVPARPADPLVAKPSCRPGISRIIDAEGFPAMGRDLRILPISFHAADSVEDPGPGWPELDFVQ